MKINEIINRKLNIFNLWLLTIAVITILMVLGVNEYVATFFAVVLFLGLRLRLPSELYFGRKIWFKPVYDVRDIYDIRYICISIVVGVLSLIVYWSGYDFVNFLTSKDFSYVSSPQDDNILIFISLIWLLPIFEEFLFREFLYNVFLNKLKIPPYFVSYIIIILFSLYHMNFYLSLFTLVTGTAFLLTYRITGDIILAIMLHSCSNIHGYFNLNIINLHGLSIVLFIAMLVLFYFIEKRYKLE